MFKWFGSPYLNVLGRPGLNGLKSVALNGFESAGLNSLENPDLKSQGAFHVNCTPQSLRFILFNNVGYTLEISMSSSLDIIFFYLPVKMTRINQIVPVIKQNVPVTKCHKKQKLYRK